MESFATSHHPVAAPCSSDSSSCSSGHKSRSSSQSRRDNLLATRDSLPKKLRLKADPDVETVISWSTDELSDEHVGKIKTTRYAPGKSFLGRGSERAVTAAFCRTSPDQRLAKSTTALFATPMHALIAGCRVDCAPVEEIKVPRSEGRLRKPKVVEASSVSARKYAQDKVSR